MSDTFYNLRQQRAENVSLETRDNILSCSVSKGKSDKTGALEKYVIF
jgi:hypothetical protein